jgi:hypothetical protein
MWDDTKDDRKFISRSFHGQHRGRMSKVCYALLKTLKKEWNELQLQEQYINKNKKQQLQEQYINKNKKQPLPLSSPDSPSFKFQTAYDEFIGRFTFGIEDLDSSLLNLKTGDTLGIISDNSNNIKYTNILMTRLSIRSLLSKRQGGVSSPFVITIDAGNSLDFFQYVNFAR